MNIVNSHYASCRCGHINNVIVVVIKKKAQQKMSFK